MRSMSKLPDKAAKTNGIAIGEHVAAGIVALRANDGRNADPEYVQQPPSGPGVFEPDPTKPVLGRRLSRIRPLAPPAVLFAPGGASGISRQVGLAPRPFALHPEGRDEQRAGLSERAPSATTDLIESCRAA